MDIVPGYEKLTKGGIVQVETRSLLEVIREEATARIMKASPGKRWGLVELYEAIIEQGLVVWLEHWPAICKEMQTVNREKLKILKEISCQGKFTESFGWSENGQFKASWEYTPEFYFFMKNYVYRDFFEEEERKIRERFMKDLMMGLDPMETLMKLKARYGSNHQEVSVVQGGERGSCA